MRIELGFNDIAYADRYSDESPLTGTTKKRRTKRPSRAQTAYGEGKTTGQIAKQLEAKYKIVETFFEMEQDYIIPLVENAITDTMIARLTGRTPDRDINEQLTSRIERRFKSNLSGRKYDGVISGVPTMASIRGVSHLRQKPYAQGKASRPSFIDTGLYQRTFNVEVKED